MTLMLPMHGISQQASGNIDAVHSRWSIVDVLGRRLVKCREGVKREDGLSFT